MAVWKIKRILVKDILGDDIEQDVVVFEEKYGNIHNTGIPVDIDESTVLKVSKKEKAAIELLSKCYIYESAISFVAALRFNYCDTSSSFDTHFLLFLCE